MQSAIPSTAGALDDPAATQLPFTIGPDGTLAKSGHPAGELDLSDNYRRHVHRCPLLENVGGRLHGVAYLNEECGLPVRRVRARAECRCAC